MPSSAESVAPETPAAQRPLVGIAWMLATGVLFACVTGIVRYLGSDMPAIEAAFIRYAIGLVMVLPLMRPLLRSFPAPATLRLYGYRGLVHAGAVMLWFYAMARVPIAEVTAIGYTAPIFVTLGAAFFFGETLHARRILAVVAGFLGTLLVLRPGFEAVSLGQLAQLAAAPLFAASFLIAKRLTEREDPAVMVGMLSLFCTVALLPGALLQWRTPTAEEVFWLAMTAAFATAGHYTMTKAIAAAPLTVTQPAGFLQLVWAALIGMALFGEPLDPFVFAGAAVIVGAATYISHREAVAARRQRTPPDVALRV